MEINLMKLMCWSFDHFGRSGNWIAASKAVS